MTVNEARALEVFRAARRTDGRNHQRRARAGSSQDGGFQPGARRRPDRTGAGQPVVVDQRHPGGADRGGGRSALSRLIAGPIRSMSQAMLKLADGDTSVAIPGIGNGDEIGEMAPCAGVQGQQDRPVAWARNTGASRNQSGQGQAHRGFVQGFRRSSTEAVKSVAAAASQMQSSSEAMSATAEEATRQPPPWRRRPNSLGQLQTVASAAENCRRRFPNQPPGYPGVPNRPCGGERSRADQRQGSGFGAGGQ